MTHALHAGMTPALPVMQPAQPQGGAGDVPQLLAVLQSLVQSLTSMLGVFTAQCGANLVGSGVQAGGAAASDAGVHAVVSGELQLTPEMLAQSGVQLTMGAPSEEMFVDGTTGGGGPVIPPPPVIPSAPESPPVPVIEVKPQYLTGTPAPGESVDLMLRSAMLEAPPARSDGEFMWVMDSAGAGVYAHVHGRWMHDPAGIAQALRDGLVVSHLHADGSLHLHDIA